MSSRIQLPLLYQDHMMLQREKPLRISGAADSASVTVALGCDRATAPVENGRFFCELPPQPAGREQSLLFYLDDEKEPALCVSHISIGDIWMACGQSNMEYFLRYDADWQYTKTYGKRNPDIHMFNCPRIAFDGQTSVQEDCGYWFQEDDEAWPAFSAPGYHFAAELQPSLEVPVGIIGCNWGGTPACAWMDEESLRTPPLHVFNEEYEAAVSAFTPEEMERVSRESLAFENSWRHEIEWRTMMYGLTTKEQQKYMEEHRGDPVLPLGPYHHYRPSGLFHTMIETIAPFSIRGFLWYQGESDSGHAKLYDQTMDALIRCFRRVWMDDTLPFLFVQLAPFGKWLDCTSEHYAVVRDRQERVAHTVPGTGMVCIMDLGSYEDIHPKFKKEVGRRLALLAKGKVYGQPLLCESPEYAGASIQGNRITLQFLHAQGGLSADGSCTDCFRIAELPEKELPSDGSFAIAAAISAASCTKEPAPACTCGDLQLPIRRITEYEFDGDSLILTLDQAPQHPLLISFAEEDFCEVRIRNQVGLPLRPFHCTLPLQ